MGYRTESSITPHGHPLPSFLGTGPKRTGYRFPIEHPRAHPPCPPPHLLTGRIVPVIASSSSPGTSHLARRLFTGTCKQRSALHPDLPSLPRLQFGGAERERVLVMRLRVRLPSRSHLFCGSPGLVGSRLSPPCPVGGRTRTAYRKFKSFLPHRHLSPPPGWSGFRSSPTLPATRAERDPVISKFDPRRRHREWSSSAGRARLRSSNLLARLSFLGRAELKIVIG